MLLNERQENILEVLCAEDDYVTAKYLANKYLCSIRTIRYDIENIEYVLKNTDMFIEKIPRKGLKLKNKEYIGDILDKNKGYLSAAISKSKRKIILILCLITNKNKYITSSQLSNLLLVSKSTILSSIKDINKDICGYSICIKGKSNYGYKIFGDEKNIRNFINKKLVYDIETSIPFKELGLNIQISNEILYKIDTIIGVKLTEKERYLLKLKIIFFIIRNIQNNILEKDFNKMEVYRCISIFNKIEGLYKEIVSAYNIHCYEGEMLNFINIILETDSFISIINNENIENLNSSTAMHIVDNVVEFCSEKFLIDNVEKSILKDDLLLHIESMLKRQKLGIYNKNPILDDIKMKHRYIFTMIKEMAKQLEITYSIKLFDDDVAFLCVYILKALESSKKETTKNIALVCNTGRGVAKLLLTRIKNNIPEINNIQLLSINDVYKHNLDSIQLIVSTIPINNIGKKIIIVSPIITAYEISSIREYLYLDSVLKYEKKLPNDKVNISNDSISEAIKDVAVYENIATTLIEAMHMVEDVSKYNAKLDTKKILGIYIHIVMCIPRWKNKDFVEEYNIEEYRTKYKDMYLAIENMLMVIGEIYNIKIKHTEIIPILRYLI